MKKLGFCLDRLPQSCDKCGRLVDLERFQTMVDLFLEKGVTYFDVSFHESGCETAFRESVVRRYPRSSYTVTSQISLSGIQKAEDLIDQFDRQLECLELEELDYCWLQISDDSALSRWDALGAFEFLEQRKIGGQVRHIGVAFGGEAKQLGQLLNRRPEVEYVQLLLNYLDWIDKGSRGRSCYEAAYRNRRPVIAADPLRGDSLIHIPTEDEMVFRQVRPEMSLSSWALRAAAILRDVMIVLISPKNLEELEDAIINMEHIQPLEEIEQAALNHVAQSLQRKMEEK